MYLIYGLFDISGFAKADGGFDGDFVKGDFVKGVEAIGNGILSRL